MPRTSRSSPKLKLVDRALMPGDAVRRIDWQRSGGASPQHKPQRGFVKNVQIVFDVALLANKDARLYNVPAYRFTSPSRYTVGSFCVYDYHLGEIESVQNVVRIELRNGFVYDVKENLLKRNSVDVHDRTEKYSYFHKTFFYPNQQLEVNREMLQSATCILASMNYSHAQHEGLEAGSKKRVKARVLDVICHSVKVAWIVRCYSEVVEKYLSPLRDEEIPPDTLYRGPQLNRLLVMDEFLSLNYSLGDNAMLSLTQQDLIHMRNIGSKFHCGGDIKQHIIDMELRRLTKGGKCHKLSGGGSLGKSKTNRTVGETNSSKGSRLYHTAVIEPDSWQNLSQKIPHKSVVKTDADTVLNAFEELLEMSGVEDIEYGLLHTIASKMAELAGKLVARPDFPETVMQIVQMLRTRGQLRELTVMRFLLSYKVSMMERAAAEADHEQSSSGYSVDPPTLHIPKRKTSAADDQPNNVQKTNGVSESLDETGVMTLIGEKHDDFLGIGDSDNQQDTSLNTRPTTTADHFSGSEFFDGGHAANRVTDVADSDYVGTKSSFDISSSASATAENKDMPENMPKFVSTVDIANCLNVVLKCWNDVIKKADPEWAIKPSRALGHSRKSQNQDIDGNSQFVKSTASDSIGAPTDTTESVSTFNGGESGDSYEDLTEDEGDDDACASACPQYVRGAKGSQVPVRNVHSLRVGETVGFKIVMIRTIVDVMWQDGTLEKGVSSVEIESLQPHQLDENEYFPGDFVVDTRKENAELEVFGVVKDVNFAERTCTVRWFSDAANDRRTFLSEEIVSVYDISDLENFDLNILDMIARVSNDGERPVPPSECSSGIGCMIGAGGVSRSRSSAFKGSKSSSGASKAESVGTAGVVIDVDVETAYVRVLWMEDMLAVVVVAGYQSLVPHHSLLGISEHDLMSQLTDFETTTDEDEDDEDVEWLEDDNDVEDKDTSGSWTTASDDQEIEMELFEDNLSEGDLKTRKRQKSGQKDCEVGDPLELKSAQLDDDVEDGKATEQITLTNEEETAADLEDGMSQMRLKKDNFETVDHSMESVKNLSTQFSLAKQYVAHLCDKFPKFDVHPTVVAHRFLHLKDVSASKQFQSALKKELKMLSTALPDGIMVRTFEDRQDLFSCLIVGAEDTPYEQGIFQFDIKLPSNYPMEPPKVAFLSYANGKLNPNLYEDGNVCLSLLGTWAGKGTEVWSKETSTMLQILVSLQGLILNKTPYFNEAGYERQRAMQTGQENAKMYNEMVIIRLVEACTCQILSPHETFREEILEHFRFVAWNLITRLQLWCDHGTEVGADGAGAQLTTSEVKTPGFPLFPISNGFRISLQREIAKFKLAVYKMFKMLPNYDEGVVEGAHQDSRVSTAVTVGQYIVEERGVSKSSLRSEDSSVMVEKIWVDYLGHTIEALPEEPDHLNMAGAEIVVVEPTVRSPDKNSNGTDGLSTSVNLPERSCVETVKTECLDEYLADYEAAGETGNVSLSTVEKTHEDSKAGNDTKVETLNVDTGAALPETRTKKPAGKEKEADNSKDNTKPVTDSVKKKKGSAKK
ncbi:uncharacterized protein LOC142335270 isoform X3 [Convolutriloba macropyga]|uniref:uncharacterized protein LOC142335270 isoform X3 n=1 Tax=Convolutriloba macropyga TaxID=536237 RepID=UPI003F526BAB